MPVRRPITGHPLLVVTATTFAAVACTGSGKHTPPVGNLMAPVAPTITREVCVSAVPAEAAILVDGVAPATGGSCVAVTREADVSVTIEVSYPGFTSQTVVRPLGEIDGPIAVALELAEAPPLPPLEPRGNLMSPPQPPPRR